MPSSAPDLATGNLVRLTSSKSRDGARVHAFVLERRRFFDYLRESTEGCEIIDCAPICAGTSP